jgi:PDZ domain-containing protein
MSKHSTGDNILQENRFPPTRQLAFMAVVLVLSLGVVASANVKVSAEVVAPGSVLPLSTAVTVEPAQGSTHQIPLKDSVISETGKGSADGSGFSPSGPEAQGEIELVAVRVWRASLADLFYALFREDIEVTKKEQSERDEDSKEKGAIELEQSELVAQLAALRLAGVEARLSGSGARIEQIVAPQAAEVLRVGDVIVEADGSPIELASDLAKVLDRFSPGDELSLAIEREGIRDVTKVRLSDDPGSGKDRNRPRARIGIVVSNVDVRVVSPYEVRYSLGELGGPSAGLAFALEIYSKVTGADLTSGRRVAVTGAINSRGDVLPVGGVSQKTFAAKASGADLMVVPLENLEEARSSAGEMEVVGVSNLTEAVDILVSAATK